VILDQIKVIADYDGAGIRSDGDTSVHQAAGASAA
jgi:hypothetical protein